MVEVRYYTDPACIWSWGAEPALQRLLWEFEESIRVVWVMGGLARRYGPDYRDEPGGIGHSGSCFADLMSLWLDVSSQTGMPCDPRLWTQNPITSTYPVCQAVKAAAEQGPEAARTYLRRCREGLVLERRKLDSLEALAAEAGAAGLDVERFRIDLNSHAITEAFASDLDEVRAIPPEARAAGKVSTTEGRERVTFPSTVFVSEDGARRGVWGPQPYDSYREAAVGAGAEPSRTAEPSVIEAVERLGRATTPEVEALTGAPGPVVRADLWAAARDWKLRATPVLMGVIWEVA